MRPERITLRFKRAGVLAAAAVALVAAWLSLRARPTDATAPAVEPAEGIRAAPGPLRPDSEDVVLGVEIEPRTVCVGADAIVRVQLAAPHRDATITIAGSLGNPAVARAFRPGPRRVPIVIHRNGERIAQLEPSFDVVDCGGDGARILVAARRLGPDLVEAVAVLARGLEPGPLRWDFGDGRVVETEGRSVQHQYASPDARTTHIISVAGTGKGGRPVIGRAHFAVRRTWDDPEARERAERILSERNREQAALRAKEGRSPDPAPRELP